jgi:hypothetical protein
MPPCYLPSPRAEGMARPATLTREDVQVSMQARTEIPHEPGTRQSKRLVCMAEMTEDMAHPDGTAPAAYIYRLGYPAKVELAAPVLQRGWHLFYPHGDEGARRSHPRLTDMGSVLEAYAVRSSL